MWVEHLQGHHALAAFRCGNKDMDEWLAQHALGNEAIGVSRTYVLTDDGTHVVGYYSLTPMDEEQSVLPRSLRRGTPKSVAQSGYLLARLAVAIEHQGEGYALDLFVDALRVVVDASEHVGGRFIAVDPIDERARLIYSNWGFEPIRGDETGRMFIPIVQAVASFGRAAEDGPA